MRGLRTVLASLFVMAIGACLLAQANAPGVVANVKVVSDKVKDVSSLEDWTKSCLLPGMTDRDKAIAIWESVVAHQYQDSPPSEFVNNEGTVQDAIKMFNVYGYSFCGVAANEIASLARYSGLNCRISTIVAHVVPEIEFEGGWHLFDASLINFFVVKDEPADAVNGKFSKALTNYAVPNGRIASVEEIQAAVKGWLADHPDLRGKNDKLMAFHQTGGWQGWKNGPKLLADCPFYGGDGWLPARTHGWYSTMQEYDGSTYFRYEAGYSMGYRVNIQLRPGEKLIRNWSHKGLYVNMDGTGGAPGALKATIGQGNWAYCAKFGDIAPGRVGNGELIYDVPLDASLGRNAWRFENLVVEGKTLRVVDDTKQGIIEIRNPCSYVYLKGEMTLNAAVGEGGSVRVFFSDNNGLDWTEAGDFAQTGEQKIDLSKLIIRRYDYRVRVLLKGRGTSLSALAFRHDIQHSQRPLPALAQGRNTIAFSVGPQEGTVTLEGSCNPGSTKDRNLTYKEFHAEVNNLAENGLMVDMAKGSGDIAFKLDTPGDVAWMTIMTHYRARAARAGWDVQVSYDGGKTFQSVGRCAGPTAATGNFIEVRDVPPGVRTVHVKWLGTAAGNAAMLFNQRIDADYKLPGAGFRPVKVTYLWEEGGIEKSDVHVARGANETYAITCEGKPVMKSLILELAE